MTDPMRKNEKPSTAEPGGREDLRKRVLSGSRTEGAARAGGGGAAGGHGHRLLLLAARRRKARNLNGRLGTPRPDSSQADANSFSELRIKAAATS
jgi:hypothetical protein